MSENEANPPTTNTVEAFCEHIGVGPVRMALRAIDRHNTEHVWLVLVDGTKVYYHSDKLVQQLTPETRLKAVGVGGIAWDGSDWEWSDEVDITDGDWNKLDELRAAFNEALRAYEADKDAYAHEVKLCISALTRVELTKVVKVTANVAADPDALQALAEELYDVTDGSEFTRDETYWEKGTVYAEVVRD